jgi:hypothetical protein
MLGNETVRWWQRTRATTIPQKNTNTAGLFADSAVRVESGEGEWRESD